MSFFCPSLQLFDPILYKKYLPYPSILIRQLNCFTLTITKERVPPALVVLDKGIFVALGNLSSMVPPNCSRGKGHAGHW